MTRRELWELADREALELVGQPATRAFELLAEGELGDCAAADELRMLRSLLEQK